MSDPLIVPLEVEALVVNDDLRTGGEAFFRADTLYGNLALHRSVVPSLAASDGQFTQTSGPIDRAPSPTAFYNGVYVKWRLPAAFTRHRIDNVSGAGVLPPVPNRWLVVRTARTASSASSTATAWIVESDYIGPGNGPGTAQTAADLGSVFVEEKGNTPLSVRMGRNTLLGSWTESGTSLGLTAMAPGNPSFALYQPASNNVFSFIDALGNQPAQLVSYLVAGWFSDGTSDPLAGATADDFARRLRELRWHLPAGTSSDALATWTLTVGVSTSVAWQNTSLPPGGAPASTDVGVAVGTSSAEALTALVAAQAAGGTTHVQPALIEAFQLDALELYDRPDGAAELADRVHTRGFQRVWGGYHWDLVEATPATPGAPPPPPRTAAEDAVLAQLNQDQAALDAAVLALATLQRELYVMWWKLVLWPAAHAGTQIPELETSKLLAQAIDPSQSGSLAAQVAAQQQVVATLAKAVPGGDTPDALEAAIARYAAAHALPNTRALKRSAAAPFFQPADPVVLVAGKGVTGMRPTPDDAAVRLPSQLVTGLVFSGTSITAATVGSALAQPALTGVSGAPWSADLVAALVAEAFFLDPGSSAAIASAIGAPGSASAIAALLGKPGSPYVAGSVFPTGGLTAWTQNPWRPLMLLWAADYYPIAYGAASDPTWTYAEGQYTWSGDREQVGDTIGLGGLVQLTGGAVKNLEQRIRTFLAQRPALPKRERDALEELVRFIAAKDGWDLLSQALDGWNAQLGLGQPGAFVAAPASVASLIGTSDSYPPALGAIPRTAANGTTTFQPWRAGQFQLTTLFIVDEWGQTVAPITTANSSLAQLFLPPSLTPVERTAPAPLAVTSSSAAAPGTAADAVAIATLAPAIVEAGMAPSAQVAIAITGTGFASDASAQWNGRALPTTVVSATELVATVPAARLARAGTAAITVSSGGTVSAPATFTISDGPAIGALSPASVVAGSGDFTLTIDGVGFAPASVAQLGTLALATTFVSPTQLTAAVPAAAIATAGTLDVTVALGALVVPGATASLVQLTPGLLQPARVGFRLTAADATATPLVGLHPTTSPLAGWLVPNHLDASLAIYGPAGDALGELLVALPAAGPAAVCWRPAPHSRLRTLADLASGPPRLGPMLAALAGAGPATFTAFLAAIDETLWTTAPAAASQDASLAALIGRPLAVVAASLALELDGPPTPDPSWQFTFAPATPELPTYTFDVELGGGTRLDDGLVGYYVGGNWSRFFVTPSAGAAPSDFFAPIGPGTYLPLAFDGDAADLTLLVDPRAPVHAVTSILPTASVAVSGRQADDALATMQLQFALRGLFAEERPTPSEVLQPATVITPVPTRLGTWTWFQPGAAVTHPVAAPDPTPRLSAVSPRLRSGYLQLAPARRKDR